MSFRKRIEIWNPPALVWANLAEYVDPSAAGVLARSYQLDLGGLADGAAWQGEKGNLGEFRAKAYKMWVAIEVDVAAVSGTTVDFYWAESPSYFGAECCPGGTDGASGPYTGTAGDSMDDSLKQLELIGSLILTADIATIVQYGVVGKLLDPLRYGMPVVDNNAGQALEGDAIEMCVALIPILDGSRGQ